MGASRAKQLLGVVEGRGGPNGTFPNKTGQTLHTGESQRPLPFFACLSDAKNPTTRNVVTKMATTPHCTSDSPNDRFDTIIYPGVYAYYRPIGVLVKLKRLGKLESLPKREVTDISI